MTKTVAPSYWESTDGSSNGKALPTFTALNTGTKKRASLKLTGGIAFSTKPLKRPQRILMPLYCYLHPLSFVYVNFADPDHAQAHRQHKAACNDYCADQSAFLKNMDGWKISVNGTFVVGRKENPVAKSAVVVRSSESTVIGTYILLLIDPTSIIYVIGSIGWEEIIRSPWSIVMLSAIFVVVAWYSIVNLLTYGKTLIFDETGCTVSLGHCQKHYGIMIGRN